METGKILNADVLDIIFDGRNKQYGAYDLRKTYNRRLIKAMAVMFGLLLVVITTGVLAGSGTAKAGGLLVGPEYTFSSVPDAAVKPPVIPAAPKVQPKLQIVVFVPPQIVKDIVTEVPPKQIDLDGVNIGPVKQDGDKGDIVGAGIVEKKGTGVVEELKIAGYENEVVGDVQIQAQFPGGLDAWIKFLQRNLRNEVPIDNGAAAGNYTVVVSFLVDREGNITEVKAETNPGYGTAEEAIRVIQRGPKWRPAIQNGRNVVYRQRQSITFQVAEE